MAKPAEKMYAAPKKAQMLDVIAISYGNIVDVVENYR
jgi:hypothetical protein